MPKKALNPEAQKLADDLLSLIQEAGLGECWYTKVSCSSSCMQPKALKAMAWGCHEHGLAMRRTLLLERTWRQQLCTPPRHMAYLFPRLSHSAGGGPDDASALAGDLAGLLGGMGGAASTGGATASGRGASAAPGAAEPADSADDDPLAKLFGRILGGMPPAGAAPGGADTDAGPPPEFAALLQQMMGAGGLGLGGEGGPEALGMGTAMGGMPAGAPPDLAALLGAAAAGADVRGAGTAGPSGRRPGASAGAMDDDDALASSRLAGLAQHTMKTVSKQAKATRGHVEGGGAAAAQGGGGVAGGAGMGGLAQILQELGGLGAAAGGGGGGEGGEGGGQPGGVNMMVDFIMQHLLSKDVLYGPLKVGLRVRLMRRWETGPLVSRGAGRLRRWGSWELRKRAGCCAWC